jgi:alkylation response protein AidB-like acyl-CoA dehydrogenase
MMTNLFATEKSIRVANGVRQFLESELIPHEIPLLQAPFRETVKFLDQLRAKVRQNGLWAPFLPVESGGAGLNLVEFALVSEQMAITPFGHYVFNCQAPDIGNMELLHAHAGAHARQTWLQPLMAGRIRSCFAMTEPGWAGSNPVHMSTTAIRERDEFIINGHKWFATAADGAHFAIVMAITSPEEKPYERASMIIVPASTPGFDIVRNIPVMGHTGEGYHSHAEIRFENCRVPVGNLLGREGRGFQLAQERLGPGRIHHCMRWIGIAERCFDLMCRRAVLRDMGDGGVLGQKQIVQHWIAEARAEINAARLLVLHTAHKMDQEGSQSARHEISAVKFHVADVMIKVLDRSLQVHGALGMTDDTVLSYWYRHERAARIYDGPDEVHKTSLARSILKTYGLTT